MEAVLRKLKLRRSDGKDSEARKVLQKSLFSFEKNLLLGFPSHSTSFAVDIDLGLLAIATQCGDLRIYGKPGLQFSYKLSSKAERLYFLQEEARLLALCSDGSFQLLELNVVDGTPSVTSTKVFKALTGEEKTDWSACMSSDNKVVTFCVSATSDIRQFQLETFQLKEKSLTRQNILDIMPEESKEASGKIVSIVQLSENVDKYLVGFSQGVIVMWDSEVGNATIACSAVQPLEHMCLNSFNGHLTTSHTDGSYMTWQFVDDSLKFVDKVTPYGPFPCEAIRKIISSKCPTGESIVIFSGGSGRASSDNDYMITLAKGANNYIFDETTSKVVDFQVVLKDGATGWLFVLWEDQIACVNLSEPGYPSIDQPLFTGLNMAPVSCLDVVQGVGAEIVGRLKAAGEGSRTLKTSFSETWPINGGQVEVPEETDAKNMIIIGHENGDVSFWLDSVVGLQYSCTWSTSQYFKLPVHSSTDADANTPKASKYAPSEFDPRFAILKLVFEVGTGTLVVAGANGQVLVATLGSGPSTSDETMSVEFSDHSEEVLGRSEEVVRSEVATVVGFVQMLPPRPCTALAYRPASNLLAAATNDGFALFDLLQKKVVFTKCTLAAQYSVTRSMSFSNTLRESFRNLKKRVPSPHHIRRPTKSASLSEDNKEPAQLEESLTAEIVEEVKEGTKEGVDKMGEVAADAKEGVEKMLTDAKEGVEKMVVEAKEGVEKMIVDAKDAVVAEADSKKEAVVDAVDKVEKGLKGLITGTEEESKDAPMSPERARDDKQVTFDAPATPSKNYSTAVPLHPVSALHFNETYFLPNASTTATALIVGTRNGHVLIYQLTVPKEETRTTEDIVCNLGKEIHLKHGATIINLMVVDRSGKPIVGDSVEGGEAHRLVVASHEQIKIFNLPSLKPHNKYKLFTPHSDIHLRYISPVLFNSVTDESYSEWGVVCVSSNGQLTVLNMMQLRPQLKADLGANEGQFRKVAVSRDGVGFYIVSDRFDLEKFSTSIQNTGRAAVKLELKEGMRPVVKEVVAKETVATEAVAAETVATEVAGGDSAVVEATVTTSTKETAAPTEETKTNDVGNGVPMVNGHNLPMVNGHHLTEESFNGDTTKHHLNGQMQMEDLGEPYLVMESSEIIENNMSTTTRLVTTTTSVGEKHETKTISVDAKSVVETKMTEDGQTIEGKKITEGVKIVDGVKVEESRLVEEFTGAA